ncbi:MAG: hypothetical protein AAB925_02045 [Patescibacteria group bacterium]
MWKNLLASVTIPNPLRWDTFEGLLLNGIIPAVAGLVGALSVIMIIVAGILFLTSAGSPERIGTAKKALIYAIVGIVIALTAGAIVITLKSILGVQ